MIACVAMLRLSFLLLLAPLLGGCDWQTFKGSVTGGECKIFERPAYVVLGKAGYDQDWIDSQVEGGVGGCHWKRPAPRPPELDAAQVAPPAKKRGLIRRIRDRISPAKPAWPPAAAAPIAPTPQRPAPPPVAKPRSALDELLQPRDVR